MFDKNVCSPPFSLALATPIPALQNES